MSVPAWLDSRKDNNRRSRAQERARAKETGGRQSAGSGSSWRQPQDNRTAETLEQIKFSDQKGIRIDGADVVKIRKDALLAGRDPSLLIDLVRFNVRLVISIEEIPQ